MSHRCRPPAPACAGDGDGRGDVEVSGEDAQAIEDVALGLAEQRVRPLDGSLQRLVAARGVGPAAGQQPEPLIQQPGDRGRAQRRHPRGGQLDRQRDPVQAPADLADRRGVSRGQGKVAACGSGALDEQGYRVAGGGGRHARRRRRQRQRPQPEDLLTAHAQRLPARGQDAHPAAAAQDVRCEGRCRAHQVLAVVDHQQQRAFRAEELHDAAGRGDAGPGTHPQGAQDGLRHRLLVLGRVQLAQPRAVAEGGQLVGRSLHRQPGLAHSAGSGHRDQRRPRHRRGQLTELVRPADERADLDRQVPGERI